MKRATWNQIVCSVLLVLIVAVTVYALWQTPVTRYRPRSEDERALAQLFVQYITARNQRDVGRFLATLHPDCIYMVTKDLIVGKEELSGMLPGLWAQNDHGNAAFGHCMAWECWHENYYPTGMLVNPKFKVAGDRAEARFKFVAGLFMDDNSFKVEKGTEGWRIVAFARPIY